MIIDKILIKKGKEREERQGERGETERERDNQKW